MFGFLCLVLICVSPSFCGVKRRIYHGYEAPIEYYPHAVFLYFETTRPASCGSTLIFAQVVLTAAHCVNELRYEEGSIKAYLGHVTPLLSNVVRFVVGYEIHPNYREDNGRNNIAVAFLNSVVPLGVTIKKIPLALKNPPDEEILYSAGWGKQTVYPKLPDLAGYRSLRVSRQRAIERQKCRKLGNTSVGSAMICTMPLMGYMYKDDAGNGLITKTPVAILVGVLSFVANGLNFYTSVFANRRFIMEAARHLCDTHCPKRGGKDPYHPYDAVELLKKKGK